LPPIKKPLVMLSTRTAANLNGSHKGRAHKMTRSRNGLDEISGHLERLKNLLGKTRYILASREDSDLQTPLQLVEAALIEVREIRQLTTE
jgi:hypothetical protein